MTARKAGNYLLAGKSTWRGWDNWWSHDIVFGWFDTLRGVECRLSRGSGELRSAQLGPSKWCTLWCIIRCFVSDHLLASSWRHHERPTAPREWSNAPSTRAPKLSNSCVMLALRNSPHQISVAPTSVAIVFYRFAWIFRLLVRACFEVSACIPLTTTRKARLKNVHFCGCPSISS